MSERNTCPHCGSPVGSVDRFCPSCGKKIDGSASDENTAERSAAQSVCPSCGVPNSASNARCYSCGSFIEQPLPRNQGSAPVPKNSGKHGGKNSFSLQIVGIFVVFIIVVVVIELQNRPGEEVRQPAAQQQRAPSQEPPAGEVLQRIAAVESAVKADPKNADAVLQLANLLHDAKFYPRAIETYKQFLALRPKETDARVDMAICYFETGDASRAVKEIEAALKISPGHQMAMFNLGVIHLSSNNVPESKKWLQRCIDIDPQSVAGQRARELLHQH